MSELSLRAKDKFNKARNLAHLRAVFNVLTRNEGQLLPLTSTRHLVDVKGESVRGLMSIPIDHIVGSEGRYRDFDRQFLPRAEHLRGRWENIAKAHIRSVPLPPIRVFRLGGLYFVRDGNHRVSVARSEGAEFIDAEVTELVSDLKLDHVRSIRQLKLQLMTEVRRKFLQETSLDRLAEGEEKLIRFSNPGFYEQATSHIHGHKYFLNQNQVGEIGFDEAARSWFYNLFFPVVNIIIQKKISRSFPGSFPADLYLWTVARWDELKKLYGGKYPLEVVVRDYQRAYGTPFIKRALLHMRHLGRRGKRA